MPYAMLILIVIVLSANVSEMLPVPTFVSIDIHNNAYTFIVWNTSSMKRINRLFNSRQLDKNKSALDIKIKKTSFFFF